LIFRITTNGALLTEEVIDYLIRNKFFVDISYDGPEEEHNRFRKDIQGENTWKRVHNNIKMFHDVDGTFYKNRVNILCTTHPEHNGKEIDKWFKLNEDLFPKDNVRCSLVNLVSSIKIKYKKSKNTSQNFIKRFFKETVVDNLILDPNKIVFNGNCFPGGEKLYVDANGQIHMCEKVNNLLPIGDVNNGFYIDKIMMYVNEWNKSIIKNKCWECDVRFLCSACFASSNNTKINCDKEGLYELLNKYLRYKESKLQRSDFNNCNNAIDLLKQLQR